MEQLRLETDGSVSLASNHQFKKERTMRTKHTVLILVLLLVVFSLYGEDVIEYMDGHVWTSLNEDQKVHFLAGYSTGIYAAFISVGKFTPDLQRAFSKLQLYEDESFMIMANRIDRFYRINSKDIPLVTAIHFRDNPNIPEEMQDRYK